MPPFVVWCYSCTVNLIHLPKEERMSLRLLETEARDAFRSQIEDLALAEVERLDAKAKALHDEYQGVKAELMAAKRVLGAVTPPEPKSDKPPKAKTPKYLSESRRIDFHEWLTHNKDEFTSADATESLGWAESQIATALSIFREDGLIRVARMGGKTGSQKFYRSLI